MNAPLSEPSPTLSAHELFDLLWETMADILGTAATATLLRRAAKRGAASDGSLAQVSIGQEGLTYRYTLPSTWQQTADPQAMDALRILGQELRPLLLEMTGPVVLRRLGQVHALHAAGISHLEELQQ
jgi:hypothetical protein